MALTNVFRTDGWIKTVQGPAVPGAQIYVCLQPANSTSLPPTPLANIFSDVNGLVPLAQPIITDGFGHYAFYAAAGVYTIIVANGGIVQQVYPDQSVGGFSGTGGGGTALTLQVNGVNLSSQSTQNLVSGTGIGITDQGGGAVLITNTNTGVPAGTNISYAVGAPQNTSFPGLNSGQVNSSGATNTFAQYIPATSLLCSPSKFTCSVWTSSASGTLTMQIVSCAKTPSTTPTVISRANITFGGNTTLTYASSAVYTSDTITFAMSPANDYYILLNSSTALMMYVEVQADAGLYVGGTNMLGASTLTLSGGTAEVNKTIIVEFQSA